MILMAKIYQNFHFIFFGKSLVRPPALAVPVAKPGVRLEINHGALNFSLLQTVKILVWVKP